jgi:hypothetical protein
VPLAACSPKHDGDLLTLTRQKQLSRRAVVANRDVKVT